MHTILLMHKCTHTHTHTHTQTCQLCVFRSDYMLGALEEEEEEEGEGTDGSEAASRSSTKQTRFALRQIELNTVAVCNIGLFENLAEFHS